MRLFTRKSRWDTLRETAVAAVTEGGVHRLTKVTAGLVGGAVAATAASAVLSSVRQQGEK